MKRAACLAIALLALPSLSSYAATTGPAVVEEMNLARQNPALYAATVEKVRATFDGQSYVLPGGTRVRAQEGTRALDEAIRFLRSARPLQPLTFSHGMSRGAADHCADQAPGRRGHDGSDFSSPGSRVNRYGKWSGRWGENIAYGKQTARDIVLALVIDEGLPHRKHRANIFNADFNFAGAAFGPHATYGTVCTTDFARGYTERGDNRALALVARNP